MSDGMIISADLELSVDLKDKIDDPSDRSTSKLNGSELFKRDCTYVKSPSAVLLRDVEKSASSCEKDALIA